MKEKIRKYWWILILIIILFAGGAFFWFQWFPPGEIEIVCDKTALEKAKEAYKQEGQEVENGSFSKEDYTFYYKNCLREHFLFR